ncbi:MAG: molybdopterin converting factor subunit 1 [Zoogloeaceae bacterium]|jgi:molybdopterin synthase sulfur carrier subunit|nr:molybdopterin converting factor subunit 1 [Zoogloeaceae bacterium]
MIKVLYFAGVREALGASGESLDLPSGIATVGALREQIAARGEPWMALKRIKNLRCAVNQVMAGFDAPVKDGDEIAFFPPVTGG